VFFSEVQSSPVTFSVPLSSSAFLDLLDTVGIGKFLNNRYERKKQIGTGAYARVYLVHDQKEDT